jgi:gluconolactonase
MTNMTAPKSVAHLGALLIFAATALADDLPANIKIINPAVAFPEGPIYKGDTLYYVGFGGTGVVSWNGKENKVIYSDKKCGPTSVTNFGNDLLVACYDGNVIVHIRTDGSVVARADVDKSGKPILGPNDFAADGKDGVYLTGSGPVDTNSIGGKVYHVSPRMAVTELAHDIHFSNGIAVSPDGKRLLVAESEAQRIISFALNSDGSLSDRRLFLRLNKIDPDGGVDAYPDGIKFGPDGNLWIGEYSKSRVAVVTADGKSFVRAYNFPGQACPNLTFTPDGKSFIAQVVYDKDVAPWPGAVYEVSIQPR